MRPVVVTVGPLAAPSANAIALSQTPTGALTLNGALVSGGVAYLTTPRRVLITTSADDTGKTFTIRGTNWAGDVISETLAGVDNTTTYSALDYLTVTSITISATAAGALTVGTNAIASSPWVRLDDWSPNFVSLQCTVTGSPNYTVQTSMDDPNSPTNPVAPANMTWVSSTDSNVVSATASKSSGFQYPPLWTRVLLNSGASSGVTMTVLQSSNGPK